MSKKLKTIATGAALATSLLAANTKADELISTEGTAQPQVAETSQQATPASVQTAQEALKQVENAVEAQQIVVDKATEAYKVADQAHTDAKADLTVAQELASQATPENIAKAEDTVENAKTTQTTKETTVQTSQDSVNKAQDAVNNQAKVVESAKQVTAKEQADVAVAQKNVNNAQAILDGTGAQAVYDAQVKAQEIVNKDKVNVDDALVKLEVAQEADKKRQNAIDEAQKLADDNAKTLSDKTTELSNAKTNYDQVNADLATMQLAFEKAENDYNGLQNFVVTPDYVQALKDYVNNPYSILSEREQFDKWDEDAKSRLKAANQANVEANLKYSINFNDDNTTEYDVNNLPKELQTELSQYASYLLNQIRTIFGTSLTTVTSSSVDFVDQSTDKSVSKNWDTWNSSHDEESIWSTAVEYGLTDKNYSVGNYHENWSGAHFYDRDYDSNGYVLVTGPEKVTKQTLKRAVHQAVIGFMFNGYEGLHAQSISGLTDKSFKYISGQGYVEQYDDAVYLGIDFTKVDGNAGVHFITVGTQDLTSESTFNTVSIDNPYNVEKITKQYQATLEARDEAKLQVDQEKINLENAQKEYATALENDKVAKETLVNAQSIVVQTPVAQKELYKFQTILDASQKVLDQANANVLTLEADVKIKKANLDQAKEELSTQQAELKLAQDNQTKEEAELIRLAGLRDRAQENLTQSKAELEEAKHAVHSAEQKLLDLQNAPEKLEETKRNYAKALQQLTDAKATLDRESALLETLQAERNTKQAIYDDLKVKLDAALEQERQAIEARDQEAQPITDAAGKLIAYRAVDKGEKDFKSQITECYYHNITKTVTQKVAKVTTYEAKLPETGEKETATMSIIGLSLLGLATVGLKRRRN